ncbi:MAG TPA: MATE family efflux transporter, partial [Vicinamibacterales bacterium]
MGRARKAAIGAAFIYGQYGLAIVSGIVLVPMTLAYIGARNWGLWLAGCEVLNYGGMLDLGVLSVLPWLFAEAHGRRDRAAMQRLVSHGLWLGIIVSLFVFGVMTVAWRVLPSRLFLTAADVAVVGPPLALMVVLSTIYSPLGVFRAVLESQQDVTYVGTVTILKGLLAVILTVVLLVAGYGLYALALAAALPSFAMLIAFAIRARAIAPDLRPSLLRPTREELRPLFANGVGSWLSDVGWQMLNASTGIVITYLGNPGWVAVYACTSKLGGMSMNLAWVLPDSGQIGLAQLFGEGQPARRLRDVVGMMLKLHLLFAGIAAIGLLMFNPAFVTRWVGITMFHGIRLNAVLAVGVVLFSIVHGLITSAAVLGNRLQVGVVIFVNGLLQAALAVVLGHRLGLMGVPVAALVASAVTALPAGIWLVSRPTGITARWLMTDLIRPWLPRFLPIAALAFAGGLLYLRIGLWTSSVAAAALCLLYAWHMRPLYSSLPLDRRVTDVLVRFRLIPKPALASIDPVSSVGGVVQIDEARP